jgi:phosphoribosylanthranilate isomerase
MKKLIKVCGMRNRDNILEIGGLQPDMMGFIFYSQSGRFTGNDFLLPEISGNIEKVGVFVNETPEDVIRILKKYKLQAAQLHGSETTRDCAKIKQAGYKVMKAFGIGENFDWERLQEYEPDTVCFVFDTKTAQHGGSGKKFNWEILKDYKQEHPFLLSGGIKPDDVGILNKFDHPWCIGYDINSGFEIEPALKDVGLVKKFIQKIRQHE